MIWVWTLHALFVENAWYFLIEFKLCISVVMVHFFNNFFNMVLLIWGVIKNIDISVQFYGFLFLFGHAQVLFVLFMNCNIADLIRAIVLKVVFKSRRRALLFSLDLESLHKVPTWLYFGILCEGLMFFIGIQIDLVILFDHFISLVFFPCSLYPSCRDMRRNLINNGYFLIRR